MVKTKRTFLIFIKLQFRWFIVRAKLGKKIKTATYNLRNSVKGGYDINNKFITLI